MLEILHDVMYACLQFIHYCIDCIINWAYGPKYKLLTVPVPPIDRRQAILRESAVEMASKIKNKTVSAEYVMKKVIERIKEVNPVVNAVTDERFKLALEDSGDVHHAIESGLPENYFKQRPFLGVPFTTSENIAIEGLSICMGIPDRRELKADNDCDAVKIMKRAGAIPVAITNVPEFGQECRNPVYGQTNNPFHMKRTPGGFSGAQGALCAGFGSPINICCDIDGSGRMAAFYCGLFYHHPTPGNTSLKGVDCRKNRNWHTMASIGVMCTHSEDLSPLVRVITGGMTSQLNLDRPVNIRELRFFYAKSIKDIRISPIAKDLQNVMDNVLWTLSALVPSGHLKVARYYHNGLDHAISLWRNELSKEDDDYNATFRAFKNKYNGIKELLKSFFTRSELHMDAIMTLVAEQISPKVNKQWANNLLEELKNDLTATLCDDAVLIFPSAPAAAPYHHVLKWQPFNSAYMYLFNALRFPVTQVPVGVNSKSLPMGIQVVAAPNQDALCIAVARYLEQQFGGQTPPCRI